MKNYLLSFALVLLIANLAISQDKSVKQNQILNSCQNAVNICELLQSSFNISPSFGSKVFEAVVNNDPCLQGTNNTNYGCLASAPNQIWVIIEAQSSGTIDVNLNSQNLEDVDGAIWSGLNSDFSNACSILNIAPVSCDFGTSSSVSLQVPNATIGAKYLLLITNFSNNPTSISLAQPQNGTVLYREVSSNINRPLAGCYSFENSLIDSVSVTNATGVGTIQFTEDRFGKPSGALSLNGNSYCRINTEKLINSTYTLSSWFKIDELPSFNSLSTIISLGGAGADQGMFLNNNYFVYSTAEPVDPFFMSYFQVNQEPYIDRPSFKIELNTWYNYAVVRSTDSLITYINGDKISSLFAPLPTKYTDNLGRIGARINNAQYFKGSLDDVFFFSRALDKNEVATLYNTNSCPFTINPCTSSLLIQENFSGVVKKQASLYIEAELNSIILGSQVEYSAGKSLLLNPGFKVENGAIFKTRIGGCE